MIINGVMMKKKIAIIVVLVLIVVVVTGVVSMMFFLPKTDVDDNTVVGSVNGINVCYGELRDEMNRNKAQIVAEFSSKYGADVNDENFWETEFDGVTPIEYLRKISAENIVEYKVLQKKAVEYGVIGKDETSYASFLAQLDEQNNNRSQKAGNSEVIYGAKEYTKDTFYKYLKSIIEIELIAKFADDGVIKYTDKQLKEYFNSIKDREYKNSPIAEYEYFSIEISEDNAEEIIKQVMNTVKTEKDYIKVIKKKYPLVSVSNISLNDDTERSLQKENGNLYSAMVDLEKSEVSPVFTNNNYLCVIKCLSYKDGGYKSFEENKSSIAMQYRQAKYDELMQVFLNNAQVDWNEYYSLVTIE